MKTTEPSLWRRAGAFLVAVVSIPASGLGAGVLFWAVHPLWLGLFWTLQGFPPNGADIVRWYAPGAFLIAPAVSAVLVGALIALTVRLWRSRLRYRLRVLVGGLIGFLLIPPLAYSLLLVYAEMWAYRAWDVMMPTLVRAYGVLGVSSTLVGALIGASVRERG